MTDERMEDALWSAIRRLPRGGGIVFRHYRTPAAERRRLFARVVRIARARGLVVIRAGDPCGYGAAGSHAARRRSPGLHTAPVHSMREAMRIAHICDAVFISPVYATRSHPGDGTLGTRRAGAIARVLPVPAVALGGMDAARFAGLRGFHGWAAIDAWMERASGPELGAARSEFAPSILATRGRPDPFPGAI